MNNHTVSIGLVIILFFGIVINSASAADEYTDLVSINNTFTTQADWMHDIPVSFHVDKATIKIVGGSAEFGSDKFKLWLHITDDAISNYDLGEDPYFVKVLILDNFDFILIEENLNATQIGWLNGDGDIFCHLLTTNEYDQYVIGRFRFQVNYSQLTVEKLNASMPVLQVESEGLCGGNEPCFDSIAAAIQSSENQAIINIAGEFFWEDVNLDTSKDLVFKGGWDSNFTTQTSYTMLYSLTISQGKIEVDRIVLEQ